jgi:radical SAM protein with 4Fe4S-binding SPASM domain
MTRYREVNHLQRQVFRLREFLKRKADPRFLLYRLRWNYAARVDYVGAFPVNLDIEPTEACNLKCVMCPTGFNGAADKRMIDMDLTRRLIDEAAAHGTYSVKFTFRGEPALHRGLAEMVRYAKAKGIPEVQFTTNGIPYTEAKVRELVDAGLDRIIFSIDGADKETVERIRLGVDYDRLVANIKAFHRVRAERGGVKPFIRVQMVRTRDNWDQVDAFIALWKPWVDDIRINDVTDRGQGDHMAVGDQRPVGRARCPQPWQRMVVSSDGTVVPCCLDWNKAWTIGDATKEPLAAIWRGAKMEAMRQVQREGRLDEVTPCRGCAETASYVWERVPAGSARPPATRVKLPVIP